MAQKMVRAKVKGYSVDIMSIENGQPVKVDTLVMPNIQRDRLETRAMSLYRAENHIEGYQVPYFIGAINEVSDSYEMPLSVFVQVCKEYKGGE